MRHLFTALATVALLGGATACATDDNDEDIAVLDEGPDESKTDQPDLALTVLDVDRPVDPFSQKVGVIKSRAAFEQVFGVAPPSSVHFDRQWVAYYTAGAQTSGGYHASIDRIRLSDTGKTLRITAHLQRPGFDCVVTQAITAPFAVVAFDKPSPAPSTNRYYYVETTRNCSAPTCGSTVSETIYEPTTGHEACTVTAEHCLTSDSSACPQLTPLPPTFCSGGTIKTVPNYIDSSDGMECSIPSVHCVTNNPSACPLFTPLPPNYCPSGTELKASPNFIPSADGMECSVPHVYCVSTSTSACPSL